jgi:hypothetical protein
LSSSVKNDVHKTKNDLKMQKISIMGENKINGGKVDR